MSAPPPDDCPWPFGLGERLEALSVRFENLAATDALAGELAQILTHSATSARRIEREWFDENLGASDLRAGLQAIVEETSRTVSCDLTMGDFGAIHWIPIRPLLQLARETIRRLLASRRVRRLGLSVHDSGPFLTIRVEHDENDFDPAGFNSNLVASPALPDQARALGFDLALTHPTSTGITITCQLSQNP